MDYSFIDVLLAFILGCVVAARITNAWNREVFKAMLEDLGIRNQDLIRLARKNGLDLSELAPTGRDQDLKESTVLRIRLEQHQGQIYAFRKDTDQFLGQGADTDTLIQRLNETLKPCKVVVAKEDGADLLKQEFNIKYD